jgi:hypothetical protein
MDKIDRMDNTKTRQTICDICNKDFMYPSKLLNHQMRKIKCRSTSDKVNFFCTDCNKHYKSKHNLLRHYESTVHIKLIESQSNNIKIKKNINNTENITNNTENITNNAGNIINNTGNNTININPITNNTINIKYEIKTIGNEILPDLTESECIKIRKNPDESLLINSKILYSNLFNSNFYINNISNTRNINIYKYDHDSKQNIWCLENFKDFVDFLTHNLYKKIYEQIIKECDDKNKCFELMKKCKLYEISSQQKILDHVFYYDDYLKKYNDDIEKYKNKINELNKELININNSNDTYLYTEINDNIEKYKILKLQCYKDCDTYIENALRKLAEIQANNDSNLINSLVKQIGVENRDICELHHTIYKKKNKSNKTQKELMIEQLKDELQLLE